MRRRAKEIDVNGIVQRRRDKIESVMDAEWQRTFKKRMHRFSGLRPAQPGDIAVSIKVRVTSGCFHREHSPQAYALIDSDLDTLSPEVEFIEHENGPEILAYLAAATAGLTLAKSVVDLVTTIIKARSEGVKKGDHPQEPLELIVRSIDDGEEYREEVIFRVGHTEPVDPQAIENHVEEAVRKLLKNSKPDHPPNRRKRKG